MPPQSNLNFQHIQTRPFLKLKASQLHFEMVKTNKATK